MLFPPDTTLRERLSGLRSRFAAQAVGIVVAAAVFGAGDYVIGLDSERMAANAHAELLSHGNELQARITRELSNALYLSSGLSAYVAVRHRKPDRGEIDGIFSRLYAKARHVRNFSVATGTTLTYVYPLKGNEIVLGLRYQDLPEQWPGIKAIIDSGKPLLTGPIDLVQGGRGLIYRIPILADDKYWGLLSTVVNVDSLFASAFGNSDMQRVDFALRGKDARGLEGDMIWGDEALFKRPGIETMEVEVPGGNWVLAVAAKQKRGSGFLIVQMRVLTLVLALLAGWYAFYLVRQRARLAHMALYDALTGLPNRRLIEDRIQRVVLQQHRNKEMIAAVLLLDLNGFKLVNDRHGHRAGDHVLQLLAGRVSDALRVIDTVGRWGGDEFVVVMQDVNRQKLPDLVDRIRQAVELPMTYAGETLQVGVSIGIAIVPDDGADVARLVRLADQRMYSDKAGSSERPASVVNRES